MACVLLQIHLLLSPPIFNGITLQHEPPSVTEPTQTQMRTTALGFTALPRAAALLESCTQLKSQSSLSQFVYVAWLRKYWRQK